MEFVRDSKDVADILKVKNENNENKIENYIKKHNNSTIEYNKAIER